MSVFINYPHKKASVPLRLVVPTMFTTLAMCCGLASIHYTLKQDWDRAMYAVLLSAVFDSLDGRMARLLKASSSFGEVLDSLADFLSFGVAPAMLLHQWMILQKGWEVFGFIAATMFVLCSGFRLARFTAAARPQPTLSPGDEYRQTVIKSKFFKGLATPAAAAAVMVPVMLSYSKLVGEWVRPWLGMPPPGPAERLAEMDSPAQPGVLAAMVVLCYIVLVSAWMISRVPMYSFKRMRIDRRAVIPLLVVVGLVAVTAVKDFWLLTPIVALAYLSTVVLSLPSQRRIMRRPPPPAPPGGEPGDGRARRATSA